MMGFFSIYKNTSPFSTRFLHYNHMYFYSINVNEVVQLAASTYGKKM